MYHAALQLSDTGDAHNPQWRPGQGRAAEVCNPLICQGKDGFPTLEPSIASSRPLAAPHGWGVVYADAASPHEFRVTSLVCGFVPVVAQRPCFGENPQL